MFRCSCVVVFLYNGIAKSTSKERAKTGFNTTNPSSPVTSMRKPSGSDRVGKSITPHYIPYMYTSFVVLTNDQLVLLGEVVCWDLEV
jgi:hypothetical protein